MKKKIKFLVGLLFVAILTTSCGGSSINNSVAVDDINDSDIDMNSQQKETFVELEVDASAGGISAPTSDAKNKFTYLNLSSGSVIDLTDDEASTSIDWDIAFKRNVVKLNGGASGTKGVKAYSVGNNNEAYDSNGEALLTWFKSATGESELSDFTNVSIADAPADELFTSDNIVNAVVGDGSSGGWWLYDPATHIVSANVNNYWILKSSEGNSFSKFRVSNLVKSTSFREITVEMNIQGSNETNFRTDTIEKKVEIPLEGGFVYFDFDSQLEVLSSDASWDFCIGYDSATRNYDVFLNGGVSGKENGSAFGPFEAKEEFSKGSEVPFFTTDTTGGIFIEDLWYAYNLEGNHKLWPNFKVYLIKSGESLFKIQILSYYNHLTTEGGFLNVRFEECLEKQN